MGFKQEFRGKTKTIRTFAALMSTNGTPNAAVRPKKCYRAPSNKVSKNEHTHP